MLEGAQLEDLPSGLAYSPNCASYGGVRFGREVLRQRCWFAHREPSSSVVITELRGLVTAAELAEGLAQEAEKRKNWIRFEPVETLVVARHPAWGWYETSHHRGKDTGIAYTAVIPWSDRSYSVTFSGRQPEHLDRELAKRVVSSFVVLRSGDLDWSRLLAALLIAAALVAGFRHLRRAQAERTPPPAGPPSLRDRTRSSPPPRPPKPR